MSPICHPVVDVYIMTGLKVEIPVSVVVRYVLDHLVDEVHFRSRKLSVLDVLSDEIAEDAAEILVTRI